jgi:diguanylate cyclase (GGDEF)-like protein
VASSRAVPQAGLRTALLAFSLVAASALLLFGVGFDTVRIADGFELQWWAIALVSIAAELMVFHVESRREVYSFTFSEIPLVLGLLLASPYQFIAGRLLGEFLFLVVREVIVAKQRQSLQKLGLNLALFLAECVVLLGVHELVGGSSSIDRPRTWAEALFAVSAANFLGLTVVALAVKWHGGPMQFRSILAIGALTAPVNTSLALVAGLLLTTDPWACLLLAGLASFLVVSYRSYSALSQRFESLSLLYDFTRLVSGAQRPDVVLEAILVQAKDLLRAERAQIWLADERGGYLCLTVDDHGRSTRDLPAHTGDVIAAWFAADTETTVITRTSDNPRHRQMAAALDAHDCIVAPVTEAGAVVGLVAVANRLGDTNGFRLQEGPMFATLANHASVALENGRLIVRLHVQAREREHESLHDALTGLPNRVLLGQRLADLVTALAPLGGVTRDGDRPMSMGVAVMDLDGFKEINDTLGHQSGDKVLVEVASRITHTVDSAVVVARLGGDEFALLFPSSISRHGIETSARDIRAALALPMHIDGVRINVGISIGIALAPEDGHDGATLLQRADVAMYGAKAGLGEGVHFYDIGSDTNTPRRLALANDLRHRADERRAASGVPAEGATRDGVVTGYESLATMVPPAVRPGRTGRVHPLAERTA